MRKFLGIFALAAAGGLAACDGNPFLPVVEADGGGGDGGGGDGGGGDGGIGGGDGLPPGTPSPTPTGAIFRMEEGSAAQTFVYDDVNDEFTVDNLPFDGDGNLYVRVSGGSAISTLDPDPGSPAQFAVYDSDSGVNAYKMVYGVGASQQTRFAIVRSPAYLDLGFGGFVYERDGSVVIPTSGSANYNGEYAGIRNYDADGRVDLVEGEVLINVDFEDLNAGDAVQGFIFNRTVYDPETGAETAETLVDPLPTLVLNTGSITEAGEISGTAGSSDGDGNTFETGEYFGIISGAAADEIVGIVVVTSDNPDEIVGGQIQETGGFLANSP